MTFTLPIFHDATLVGFACCMAHWPDIGGNLDGVTTDIYQEWSADSDPRKYQRAGTVNQDVLDIILMNACGLPKRRRSATCERKSPLSRPASGVSWN